MKKRYDGLLGMRGLGALMVIAYHVYVICGFMGKSDGLDLTIGMGGVFVSMFFMLSAFSCMCGYFERFTKQLNEDVYSDFYIRRLKKLLPTFWVALICHCIIDFFLGNKLNASRIFGTASLLYGFMPQFRESMVDAGWSMGIEMIFYLVFPAFTIACFNKRRTWGTLLFSFVLLIAYINYYSVGADVANNTELNFIRQLVYFVVGALLYNYIEKIEAITQNKKWLYYVFLGVQLCSFACLSKASPLESVILLSILFAAMIINQIGYNDYLINNRFLKWIGKNSYQIYMFHMIIYKILWNLNVWEELAAKHGWLVHFLVYLLLEISLTLLFCIIFNLLSKKIQVFFVRKSHKRSSDNELTST